MEIKKFNERTNMITMDEAFNRLMNVLDLVNKNLVLINSLNAGLEDRYERESADLWQTDGHIQLVKNGLKEYTNDWKQLIINIEEHFAYEYERGAVNYNPQSLLQDTERIDYDLKRVIAICSNEDLMKYFEKIEEVNRDNNEQIRDELDLNRDDNLESYWNSENFEILSKSVESISSYMSYCRNELFNFVENQKEKLDENENEAIKLVQEISELEEQRSIIDKKISEKISELNTMLQNNEKHIEDDFQKDEIQEDPKSIDNKEFNL